MSKRIDPYRLWASTREYRQLRYWDDHASRQPEFTRIPKRICYDAGVENTIFRCEMRRCLSMLIAKLPRNNAITVCLGFGLFGNEEKSERDIAALLGISPARVWQIKQKALQRLRHPSISHHLYPFREGFSDRGVTWNNPRKIK